MFHVIVNPTSNSGRGKSQWDKIETLFRNSGAPYKVYFSSAHNRVEDICEDLTSRGEECRIVVLGGDGTMNADLVKGLGIKKSREELVASIVKGETVRTCDIGRLTYHNRSSVLDSFTHKPVDDKAGDHALKDSPADSGESDNVRLFNISAGIGFDAAVCQRADSSFLKPVLGMVRMGKLIYISEAVHMILASPMVGMKITCDGKDTYRPRTLFTVVMNTCYEGGGFKFCPDAVNSDGLLDLFGANDLSRMNFFRIFPTAYDGNHLRFKGLFTDRGRSFTISSAVPLWVHTDGEVLCKSSKITIDVFPHKLQLMV